MTAIEALRSYSRQEASLEQVVRALIEHDDWLVTAPLGIEVMQTQQFEKGLVLSAQANMPNDQLWFFTDENAANNCVAKGGQPGFYVGPIPGARLLEYLPHLPANENDSIQINIGSPREESFYLGQDSFSLVALWARAIGVEAILNAPDSDEKFRTLRDFPGYTYFIFPDQDAIATAQGAGGLTNPAMVFTAPDCAAEISSRYPQLERLTVDGQSLFSLLPSQGVDGVVFNPLGPGSTAVFELSMCEQILSVPDAS